MSSINYDLQKIKAFLFDVDGALSANVGAGSESGEPIRTINIKDSYAIQLAIKKGYIVGIITGAHAESVRHRYSLLGVEHIYLRSAIKIHDYLDFIEKTGLKDEEIAYVGDDIPDYPVMERVGLPIAPADGAAEIKAIAKHISQRKGGMGLARELIEQTLKARGDWMCDKAFGW